MWTSNLLLAESTDAFVNNLQLRSFFNMFPKVEEMWVKGINTIQLRKDLLFCFRKKLCILECIYLSSILLGNCQRIGWRVRLCINTFFVTRVKCLFDIRIYHKNIYIIETYMREFNPPPLVWVQIWIQYIYPQNGFNAYIALQADMLQVVKIPKKNNPNSSDRKKRVQWIHKTKYIYMSLKRETINQ